MKTKMYAALLIVLPALMISCSRHETGMIRSTPEAQLHRSHKKTNEQEHIAQPYWIVMMRNGRINHSWSRSGDATGTVEGKIMMPDAETEVTLENKTALYTTHADPLSGDFTLRFVQPGIYTLKVYPENSTAPIDMPNIKVIENETTDIGMVVLRHVDE